MGRRKKAAGPGRITIKCEGCGNPFEIWASKRGIRVTCSRKCFHVRMKKLGLYKKRVVKTPRICVGCGESYIPSMKRRRYCTYRCFCLSGGRARLGKDANHDAIVAEFKRLGCGVRDMSEHGSGVPDLFVSVPEYDGIFMVEVKNPNTEYGRKGLSSPQRRFQNMMGPVHVVRTAEDAIECARTMRLHAQLLNDAIQGNIRHGGQLR